ncbi:MAG: hypothetical protein ABIR11_00980 [Candidatus Limnocylindrales bacterium]
MTVIGSIGRIAIAPVKGLALVHPAAVDVTTDGVPGDRGYVMLDSAGRLASGKRFGPMQTIVPSIMPSIAGNRERLSLRFPDGTVVEDDVDPGDEVEAIFYGAARPARLVRGPFAAALSAFAGQPLTVVRLEHGLGLDRADEGGMVSIQSSAALATMAEAAGLDAPVDWRRFRMTFTLDGVPAHAEDGWVGQAVRIGGAVVRPGGNIGRCAVTTQDPDTGLRSLDTLRLIAETRGDVLATEPLPFGVWAEVVVPGRVGIGDPVELVDGERR